MQKPPQIRIRCEVSLRIMEAVAVQSQRRQPIGSGDTQTCRATRSPVARIACGAVTLNGAPQTEPPQQGNNSPPNNAPNADAPKSSIAGVPVRREVLGVFQKSGIHPKASDDLRAALGRAWSRVRIICWSGNRNRIACRMTQHQVWTRSDVISRLARIADMYRRMDGLRRRLLGVRRRGLRS